jgi:hypothetical protein
MPPPPPCELGAALTVSVTEAALELACALEHASV